MCKKRVIQTFKAGSAVTTANRAVGIQERLHSGWRGYPFPHVHRV